MATAKSKTKSKTPAKAKAPKPAPKKAVKAKREPEAPPTAEAVGAGGRRRWKELSVAELQTLYGEKVGRATGSDDRQYLVWKIREAEKGKVPVGPVSRRLFEGPTTPITIKFEDTFLDALDAAAKEDGFATRLAYVRDLLGRGLELRGRAELAAKVAR